MQESHSRGGATADVLNEYGKKIPDSNPHRDADLLRFLYWEKRLSMADIGELLSVSDKTIERWLKRHGIETRLPYQRHATFRTLQTGYESWRVRPNEEPEECVLVHRLLAVAEHGFDAVSGCVVHHENGVKWDNRPENIGLFESQSDHATKHYMDATGRDELPWRDEERLRERISGCSVLELADEWGCDDNTIYTWLDKFDIDTPESDTYG